MIAVVRAPGCQSFKKGYTLVSGSRSYVGARSTSRRQPNVKEMKIPKSFKEKYETLEAIRRALFVKSRYEVAKDFDIPYSIVLAIAQFFEIDGKLATRERRFQRIVKKLESVKTIRYCALMNRFCTERDEKRELFARLEKERPELAAKVRRGQYKTKVASRRSQQIQQMLEIIEQEDRVAIQDLIDRLGFSKESIAYCVLALGLKIDNGYVTKLQTSARKVEPEKRSLKTTTRQKPKPKRLDVKKSSVKTRTKKR